MLCIQQPKLLHLVQEGQSSIGANQMWYRSNWQQRAGCGPTNCATLLWYLAQTRPHCNNLYHHTSMLELMEDVWNYATPGAMGLNRVELFARGAIRYGLENNTPLAARTLKVPAILQARPSFDEVTAFLTAAFHDDLPVAFLNLSNGTLQNLDNWHWVTLVAIEPETGYAVMYDASSESRIDLATWLRTTTLGGGFVALEPTADA